MNKKFVDKDTSLIITCHLPQRHDAKYLIVVVDRGKTVEINHFGTLKESKRIFEEIAVA
jgi:ABC-type transport system involved in cytochrome bd biosynthesis fused ATPase/permease subunit